MEALKAILSKRDSRAYASKDVSEETLREILQAGRMSGSSKNTQPWRFVVLRDAQRKAELAGCGQFAQHVPAAPIVIAIVLTPGGGDFDAGRAAQNMMLAAWTFGITSCPVAMHDREGAARVLGLPEGHRVAMVISFGYPESEASLHRGVVRTELGELVHHERWQESSG
jgi:nitroreductase